MSCGLLAVGNIHGVPSSSSTCGTLRAVAASRFHGLCNNFTIRSDNIILSLVLSVDWNIGLVHKCDKSNIKYCTMPRHKSIRSPTCRAVNLTKGIAIKLRKYWKVVSTIAIKSFFFFAASCANDNLTDTEVREKP